MSTAETLYYRCIPRLVTHDRDLPRDARYLFIMIAEEAHLDTGSVQMTTEYLADISDMSVSTVLRNLPLLEEKGYLRVIRARKGSKIPNVYQIIGAPAEVVIRKGKAEAGQSTTSQPVSDSQSTPNQAAQRQSSSLNRQVAVGESSALNRPTDSRPPAPTAVDNPSEMPSTSPQLPQQLSDSHLTKEQEKQEKNRVLNVVETENIDPIFELKGVHPTVMQGWIDQYGISRVQDVIQGLGRQKYVANKGGWVRCALEKGWRVGRNSNDDYVNSAQRYITGEYAAYVDH